MKSRIIAVILLFILWVLGTYGVVDLTKPTEEIMKLIFISLGGYGVVSATLINIWNAWDTSKSLADKIEFDKTENSFKYFERWDNQSLKEARDLTRKIKKDVSTLSDDDLLNKINNNESIERSVITMFNFWEEIYKSIDEKRVNADLLKETFGSIYCDIYTRFKVWREDKKTNNENYHGMEVLDKLNKLWL